VENLGVVIRISGGIVLWKTQKWIWRFEGAVSDKFKASWPA